MRVAMLIAGWLAAQASAQIAPPLTPAANTVVAHFDAATSDARARLAALPAPGSIAENLAARVALDQAQRAALPDLVASGLTDADKRAATSAIWQRIGSDDAANTAYVKSVLPPDGWFRNTRDGRQVARDAWLIVQHSPDAAFQRQVLARMAPLVASGEANGPDYALLYDRTAMFAGRPQRYGSQMTCKDGRYVPADLEDPADLDRRRAEVGLGPMADYRKNFAAGC
jgi:hypothetical protein